MYSHPSKIDFVARAKALGYAVIMVVIHLERPELNAAGVAQRVREGGHDVPTEKLLQPIPRMLVHVQASIPLCDQVRVLDNSSAEDTCQPVMTIRGGQGGESSTALAFLGRPNAEWVICACSFAACAAARQANSPYSSSNEIPSRTRLAWRSEGSSWWLCWTSCWRPPALGMRPSPWPR